VRIGIIGTGTIAAAVVRGIAGDGHQIRVSERSAHASAALADAFENVTIAPNQQVLDQGDVIFLGLMAGAAPDILAPLTFRADQRVISFMAGADLGQVGEMIAPARASAVMMPFPGIAQGGSAIMALGDTDLVNEIFGARNRVFALKDNAELDAYLCAQAVLSPVARMVGDAADWLGTRVSDPAQGEAFLRMLVATSLAEIGCADLIEALNTPGGYNQRLRQHMEAAGITGDLMSGLNDLEG
jgi:pyrroline-5-carboxylate reductase